MRVKIHGGTVLHGEKGLCASCRFATIVRGRKLDEEVVHCNSITTRGMRVPFKVTSCTSHSDVDQPTYIELLEDAWILKPGANGKRAGFVRHSDMKADELRDLMEEVRRFDDD